MAKEYKIEIKHPRFNDEFFGFKEIEQYFLNMRQSFRGFIFLVYFGAGSAPWGGTNITSNLLSTMVFF